MKVDIKNLGIIDNGNINIKNKKLNIKYGINGIGKSTLSKGLSSEDLSNLKKYGTDIQPNIEFDEKPSSILVFNQEYVDNHLFKEDILNNSFEILINTKEYRTLKMSVNKLLEELVMSIRSSTEIQNVINELQSLKQVLNIKVKPTKTQGIKYTIPITQKFSKAQKIPDLKEVLKGDAVNYEEKLRSHNNYEWLKWFIAGKNYIEQDKCPFCLKKLSDDFEETYNNIKDSYEKSPLKINLEVKKILSDTKKYMPTDQENKLFDAFNSKISLSNKEIEEIFQIVEKCNNELNKLNNLNTLSIHSIKEMNEKDELVNFLNMNKLDINFFNNSDLSVKERIKVINQNINKVIEKSIELTSLTNAFNRSLIDNVNTKTNYIDTFLDLAGIPYEIKIVEVGLDEYKTILKPKQKDETISEKNLSFGEKNAIALILFSLEIKEKTDFIILDDPVSSFDNNKKFAILYYLFSMDCAVFKNKTILLLTHDFDIVVDFLFKTELKAMKPSICYLSNDDGYLNEKVITTKQIQETLRQWKKKANDTKLNLLLRIVNLRKYIMYALPEKNEAINILSSLEHNDKKPMKKEKGVKVELTEEEIEKGITLISEMFSGFDYDKYLSIANDLHKLKTDYSISDNSIDKLQLLRAIIERKKAKIENKVVWDFITQYYHVENNDMITLNEKRFNLIPGYIMVAADEIFNEIIQDHY